MWLLRDIHCQVVVQIALLVHVMADEVVDAGAWASCLLMQGNQRKDDKEQDAVVELDGAPEVEADILILVWRRLEELWLTVLLVGSTLSLRSIMLLKRWLLHQFRTRLISVSTILPILLLIILSLIVLRKLKPYD